MTGVTKELVEHWKKECNRYTNGICSTKRCLVRGGYESGPPDYALATCEVHETIAALEASPCVEMREALEGVRALLADLNCIFIRDAGLGSDEISLQIAKIDAALTKGRG